MNQTFKTLLIATAALFFGLVAGQVIPSQAMKPSKPVEVEPSTVIEYQTVERILPVEIPVSVPFDHEAHASGPGYMTNSERACNLAIAPLAEFANDIETQMVCLSTEEGSLLYSDYAGFYNGTVVIFTAEWIEYTYYAEVAAHELGHAFDATQLDWEQRDQINEIMGWEVFDLEHYADVVAYDLGYWSDYGNGWRHEGEAPSDAELAALHTNALLPIGY